jgi:hypothetical protein
MINRSPRMGRSYPWSCIGVVSSLILTKVYFFLYNKRWIFFLILGIRASPLTRPTRPPARVFSSGRCKSAQSRPWILVFARIWAFIHPASPGHPRPSGARSGTPDERNAREKATKIPARRVAPTCRREWAVVDAWWMTSPLGTPRGKCDEYSSLFSLS